MTTTTTPPALVAALGAGTVAWYAMPDLIRSRGVRTVLKTALLGGVAAAAPTLARAQGAPSSGEVFDEVFSNPDLPGWVVPAALGVTVLGTVATVWGEKAVYAFGERRRARGVRFAHTVPALALGALAAVAVAVDPPGAPA